MSKKRYIGPALRTVVLAQSTGALMYTSLRPHKDGAFNIKGFETWEEYDEEL